MSEPNTRDSDEGSHELPRPRPPAAPAALLVTLLGVGLGAYLLYDIRGDLFWWASSPPVVDLGAAGSYRLDGAKGDVVAKIAGNPGGSAARFRKFGKRFEIVAIAGTNVVVQRELTGPDLPLPPGAREPPPDPSAFAAEGRLLRDDGAPADYGQAFRLLVERGDAQPVDGHLFLLLDGDKPFTGWRLPATLLAIAALIALNLWTFVRAFLPRR